MMTVDNLFADIPAVFEEELCDVLLKNENIRIERIVSNGQNSPASGWYNQSQNEWVVVLKGEAIIKFENKQVNLQAGSYLNIPAHTKHKVSWTNPDLKTVWLAIFY